MLSLHATTAAIFKHLTKRLNQMINWIDEETTSEALKYDNMTWFVTNVEPRDDIKAWVAAVFP